MKMPRLLHYFAHPGLNSSRINSEMFERARAVEGVTHIDLYAEFPRYHINIDGEQQRLLDHDILLLQFPFFWYSCPALVKEWIDLVLEHGFAYGEGGDKLKDKTMMLALTTGGPQDAYQPEGYQHFHLRTFLTPFEQTARLCQMHFLAPYVLHGALSATPDDHAAGFVRLIEALRDGTLDTEAATTADILTHDTLPLSYGA
ncbi:MAG: NAD(P)H-dependent oxidoreductase [Pseudomonadota bacterium]